MPMNPHGDIPEFRRRYRYLVTAVVLVFGIIFGRLYQMQIMQGDEYFAKSQENFIQERRIMTVRGLVFDRRGRPMVTNRPSFDVYLTPQFATAEGVERLIQELEVTPQEAQKIRQRVDNAKGRRQFQRQLVRRDVSRDQMARLESRRDELPGVSVAARAHRNYIHGNLASHVLGYLNEVTAEELRRDAGEHYRMGELIGRFGVERMYETHLRGVPGWERIVVDARGRRKTGPVALELLGGEQRMEPKPGHNITLTVDIEVQRLVERALRHYSAGGAVVIEVDTGRILASASKPAFEPNLLTGHLSPKEARRLVNDPHRPLLDKVYRENYFPGSTYKVITGIAALEEGMIDPEQEVNCTGGHHFGRRTFRCSHSHGKVGMHAAIVESCNVYFFTLAETVGMDMIAHYAHLFGLGAPTGLGLNGEVSGFIPTKEWYAKRKQPFRIGFTLNAAIGQGNVKTTPLQIASLYATIANRGALYLPQIVERIESSDGQVVQSFKPRLRRRIDLKPETWDLIQAGLAGVVAEEKGTAHASQLDSVTVAGKTGTAQVSRRIRKGKTIWLEDHSWFAAYAPTEHPRIAVAVLIEHGGRAAKVAAPVAMHIIRDYFRYVAPVTADARGNVP